MPVSPESKINFKQPVPTVSLQKRVAQDNNRPLMAGMAFVVSIDGTILDVNDGFAAALGIPPNDLRGRKLLDSVLFENFDDLMDDRALFNKISSGSDSSFQSLRSGDHKLIIGPDRKHVSFYCDWIRGQGGKRYMVATSQQSKQETENTSWSEWINYIDPEQAIEAHHEIEREEERVSESVSLATKETKKPEKSRKQSFTTADIRNFMAMNADALCLLSPDGDIVRYNEIFFQNWVEYHPEKSFLDWVHPEDRAGVRQYLQSFQKHDTEKETEPRTVEFEARMVSMGDRCVWMQWHVHENDELLYCIGHDITVLKINEKALRRREQELSEAQALAHMGHWRWRIGDEAIEWSDQIYDIFGVRRGEFIPTLDNTNALLHKRDIGRMMQAFQRAIIEQNDYDMDFRVIHGDGSMRYVRCEGRCELDEDGDAVALYGVMQDITDQTEYEMQLKQAKDAAEQAYASKSRFLANMSHELRTPLNAVIGFSDMIAAQMMGPVGSEKYIEYAQNIKDSGEHLLSLITDILDMSKIEAGKYELDLEKIQLGAVIDSAVRMIEARAKEGQITLENTIKTKEPVIIADRRAVMQILLNLLSNAVKFTEPDGKITISLEEFDNHVTIRVQDDGIGIPANKLNAVLRPFEQVSNAFTRNHEGSGLGLAITKELIELHNGQLILESQVGEGTIACVRLPREHK